MLFTHVPDTFWHLSFLALRYEHVDLVEFMKLVYCLRYPGELTTVVQQFWDVCL